MGRKISAAIASALVFALAGFLLAALTGPVWEARATLAVASPEALAALPGILAGAETSAHRIPGTDVMEVSLRAGSAELARTGLEARLSQIPVLLTYLEISPEYRTLATAARCVSLPQPGLYALWGGALGALAAALWLLPPPEPREPMDLRQFLAALARAAKGRMLPVFLTVSLLAGGAALATSYGAAPQYRAEALIRVGEYHPETADGIAGAVLGLGNSQLAGSDATVRRVGSTNLFRVSTVSDSEAVALSRLDGFLDALPRLLAHISGNPPFTVLQAPQADIRDAPSPLRGAALGAALGTALWLVLLTAQVLGKKQPLFSRG